MAILFGGGKAVSARIGFFVFMMSAGKMVMLHLLTLFAGDDFAILDCQDSVI